MDKIKNKKEVLQSPPNTNNNNNQRRLSFSPYVVNHLENLKSPPRHSRWGRRHKTRSWAQKCRDKKRKRPEEDTDNDDEPEPKKQKNMQLYTITGHTAKCKYKMIIKSNDDEKRICDGCENVILTNEDRYTCIGPSKHSDTKPKCVLDFCKSCGDKRQVQYV